MCLISLTLCGCCSFVGFLVFDKKRSEVVNNFLALGLFSETASAKTVGPTWDRNHGNSKSANGTQHRVLPPLTAGCEKDDAPAAMLAFYLSVLSWRQKTL